MTAAFNLNLLERINRELDGDIDVAGFAHDAIYDEAQGRIEMHLVSLARQTVRVMGREFRFAKGERIHTENSHKYADRGVPNAGAFRRLDARPRLDRPAPPLQPASARLGVANTRQGSAATGMTPGEYRRLVR